MTLPRHYYHPPYHYQHANAFYETPQFVWHVPPGPYPPPPYPPHYPYYSLPSQQQTSAESEGAKHESPSTSHKYYTSPQSYPRPRPPRLNVLLQPPFSGCSPPLRFDLQAPQHKLALRTRASRYTQLTAATLSEPATEPGAQIMRLESELLPWCIVVKGHRGQNVTVEDVLNALHVRLHRPISKSEKFIAYCSAAKGEKMDDAKRQAQRRVVRYPTVEGTPADSRALRVDWLMDMTIFLGLTPNDKEQTWKIHLASRRETFSSPN